MAPESGAQPEMSAATHVSDRSTPCDGDVLVERDETAPVRFTIRRFPGPLQLEAPTRDAAVRIAREYAREARVDLWYVDGATCRLVDRYRRSLESDSRR